MPRYHFHIREGATLIADGEGVVLHDEAAALKVAASAAREQVSIDVRHDGVVRLARAIEIADPEGTTIHIVDFARVIQIDIM